MLAAALTTADGCTGDQPLGGDPVDVQVVDDRDLAGLEPLGQVLGALVQPGDARRLRSLDLAGSTEQGQSHPAILPEQGTRTGNRAGREGLTHLERRASTPTVGRPLLDRFTMVTVLVVPSGSLPVQITSRTSPAE